MQKTLAILSLVLIFVAGLAAGFRIRDRQYTPQPPLTQTDTLWLRDTITITPPAPRTSWVHDTTYVPVYDTTVIVRNDTAYLPLPLETRHYADEQYDAWVTGYRPSLDSIRIYQTTTILKVPVPVYEKKRWGVGLQAGTTFLPGHGVTPYLGVGVSYNFINF